MEELKELLNEVDANLEAGTISKEEASELIKDLQSAIDICEDSENVVFKGQALKTLSLLSKLV